ncbi:MAG: ABC transporter permease subunit [Vicinamibacterales bacterium]
MTRQQVARVLAIVDKDLRELARNPGAWVPAVAMVLGALVPAFLVVVVTPRLMGKSLEAGGEFTEQARAAVTVLPDLAALSGEALVQAFLFVQFSMLLLLVPVVASMALATHAVIGEKQAKTLEPLLATPLTALELLAAKTLTPFGLTLLLTWTSLGLYVGGIALVGEPGVAAALVGPHTALLFLVDGPLVGLAALLLAVVISSRVNDPRSAQQLGSVMVLPITAVFVGQLMGHFVLGPGALALAGAGLVLLNAGLLWVGIRVFDRETILMRWR